MPGDIGEGAACGGLCKGVKAAGAGCPKPPRPRSGALPHMAPQEKVVGVRRVRSAPLQRGVVSQLSTGVPVKGPGSRPSSAWYAMARPRAVAMPPRAGQAHCQAAGVFISRTEVRPVRV